MSKLGTLSYNLGGMEVSVGVYEMLDVALGLGLGFPGTVSVWLGYWADMVEKLFWRVEN